MPFLEQEDALIHFEDVGEGIPLLLLHGDWSCGAEMLALHSRLGEQRRLIVPDRRGYGCSSRLEAQPADVYGVHAQDMAALLDHLCLNQVDVHGFSGGGIVALRLALARQGLVRSLVLECTHYSSGWPPEARVWFERLIDRPETLPPATIAALTSCHGADYWPQMLRNFARACLGIFFAGGDLYAGRLAQVRCPCLVMHAAKDPYIPVEHARSLAEEIPSATLHIFPQGRHGLFDRSGDEVAGACRRLIDSFWSGLDQNQ